MESVSVLQVVAGVVRCHGKILIARRAVGKHLAGYWEFPGGKIEAGETAEESLARELMEEFGLAVTVGERIGSQVFEYPQRSIELHAFWADAADECGPGDSHDSVAWVAANELGRFTLAPADGFIMKAVG